jgi:hypothetical protein
MCLDFITNKKKIKKTGFAWKVVNSAKNPARGEFRSWGKKCAGWYRSEGGSLDSFYNDGEYPAGFHCFTYKCDAELWSSSRAIIRIEYQNILARGTQDFYRKLRVIVVEKIRIPKKKK